MKALLFSTCLLLTVSAIAQDAKNDKSQARQDHISEDFQFTIDRESTKEDVESISSRLDEIGVKHRLKILSYTEDNKIASIEFRQILHDDSNGLGCIVGALKKFTVYALDGKLACRSE